MLVMPCLFRCTGQVRHAAVGSVDKPVMGAWCAGSYEVTPPGRSRADDVPRRADGSSEGQQLRVRLTAGQTQRETPDHPHWLTAHLLRRLGMVLSRSAVFAGWQCRQGVELGLVQDDVGRCGVGGDLHYSFGADDRRGDRRAG